MKALVVKSTPSTLSYDLFAMGGDEEEEMLTGVITGIGTETPSHVYNYGKQGLGEGATRAENHVEAFERLAAVLASATTGPEDLTRKLSVLAHRVPHGGERFKGPAMINDEVLRAIDECSPLSPRRNPAALLGIRAARHLFPSAPHVAVFETAFHQTMSHEAFLYALPYELYDRVGIRRYGFHGVSHQYAIEHAAGFLEVDPAAVRIISIHLGTESSATAVVEGKCIDTTTGLTPREGLPGATMSGDLDPAVLTLLMRSEGYAPDQIDEILTKHSGVYGLSGVSDKILEVVDLASKGDDRCAVACRVYTYRIAKAVGALSIAAGGLEVLVLTAEAAVKSSWVRSMVCARLAPLGVEIDQHKNDLYQGRKIADISAETSRVRVVVVPGDPQRAIAREALLLVSGRDSA